MTLREAVEYLLDIHDRFGLLKDGPGELLPETKDAIDNLRTALTKEN